MKTFLKTDLAYLAGFVDGEGHFSIWRRKDQKYKVCYETKLIVGQSSENVLRKYQTMFGGCIVKRNREKENRKTFWTWTLSDRQAERVVKLVLPYLVVKREQAELFLAMRRKKRQWTGFGRHMTQRDAGEREMIAAKLTELIRR